MKHTREYYLDMFKRVGINPLVRHKVAGYETVRSYVARGQGFSLLNQRLLHDSTYAGGSVVPLRMVEDFPPIEVALVRPVGAKPTKKSLAFEQICEELYGHGSGS